MGGADGHLRGDTVKDGGITRQMDLGGWYRKTAPALRAPLGRLYSYSPLLVAVTVGGAWTAFLLTLGGALSVDSTLYLRTAAYMHFNGQYNTVPTVWPPFYPLSISALLNVVTWPATAGSLLSGISLLGMSAVFCLILKTITKTPYLVLSFLLSLLSLAAVWGVFEYVWSETLFTFLVLVHILLFYGYARTSKAGVALAAGGVLALAAMTKYAGAAFFLPFGLFMIYRLFKADTWRTRGVIALGGLVAVVPSLLWFVRNHSIDGSFTGHRGGGRFTIGQNIDFVWDILRADLPVVLLGLFAAAFLFFLYRAVSGFFLNRTDRMHRFDAEFAVESYLYGGMVVYTALIIYAGATTDINTLSTRFLVVLYPVLFLQAAFGIRRLGLHRNDRIRRAVPVAASLVLLSVPVTEAEAVGGFFSRVYTPKRANLSYRNIGFDNAPSAKKLSLYIERAYGQKDTIYVSGFYNRNAHKHVAMFGLFTRAGTIGRRGVADVVIEMTGPLPVPDSRRYLNHKNEFTLTYTKNGTPRRLVFFNPERTRQLAPMLNSISRLMTRHHLDALHFIVVKPDDVRESFDFNRAVEKARLPAGLKKAPGVRFGSFAVHRFFKEE